MRTTAPSSPTAEEKVSRGGAFVAASERVIRLPIRRPLLCLQTACAVLGMGEDRVLRQIESGKLVAFDLRARTAGRALYRVLAQSLRFHVELADAPQPTFDQAAKLMFPVPAPSIPSAHLAFVFAVSSSHVTGLISAGDLKTTGARPFERASQPVSRASVLDFLRRRAA